MYEVLAPKNTRGLYLEELTSNIEEYELLLPKNINFKILSFDKTNKYIRVQLLLSGFL